MRNVRFVVSAGLVAALLAAGCGADGDDVSAGPTPTAVVIDGPAPSPSLSPDGSGGEATATPEATAPTATPGPADPTAAPTADPTAAPTPRPTTAPSLPGEPFDFAVPAEGEAVAVVGVAHDDILEVHALPGESSALVGELDPTADDVVGTGHGRLLPNSIWWLVRQGALEGWVGSAFMARLGDVVDLTSDVETRAAAAGFELKTETMLELGGLVAGLMASEEPASRIENSVAPTVGDLGEITMDVVGLGDDALAGYRLHIFGDPSIVPESFVLSNVEATLLCSRGVSREGLCS